MIHLISGPAGSGKSQLVQREMDAAKDLLIDFGRLWEAVTASTRGQPRTASDPRSALVFRMKRDAMLQVERRRLGEDLNVFITSASANETSAIAERFGVGPRIIDPGRAAVEANLQASGYEISTASECGKALKRWYEPTEGFDPYLYWHGRRRT